MPELGLVEKRGTRALRHRPALSCFLPTISPSCWCIFFQPKTFCAVRMSSCGPEGVLSGVFFAIRRQLTGVMDSLSALHEYPGESIATFKTASVDSLQWNGACWFPHNNSQVACTSRTTSGEILSHKFQLNSAASTDNAGLKLPCGN